jgi:hypothetical protein
MPLTVYKRGRFWWLTGTVPTREGEQRIHESTGETDEAAADRKRLNVENKARAELDLDPKTASPSPRRSTPILKTARMIASSCSCSTISPIPGSQP